MELLFDSAVDLVTKLKARALSPCELLEAYLVQIENHNPRLNAYLSVALEQAREAAREAERVLLEQTAPPPLTGLPIAVKDTELTCDLRTTFGSLIYADFVPEQDSILVERLRRAGAVIIGKTNTPEFAMLGETRNLLGKHCANPWDINRTTGGSSGGAACAIAAGLAPMATGSDSGGSITIPAAFCGTFGCKPTHGFIPHFPPLMDWPLFLSSGPLTRSVKDAALFLRVVCGPDQRDPLSARNGLPDFTAGLDEDLLPYRIGFSTGLWGRPVDPQIRHALRAAATVLEALGCRVEEVEPDVPAPYEAWHTIDVVDQFLARGGLLEQHANQLFEGNAARLEQGRNVSAATLARAHVERYRFCAASAALFSRYDIMMLPATACTAFPHAEPPGEIDGVASAGDWDDYAPFNLWANLSGEPAVSLPIGYDDRNLPMGALLIGAKQTDRQLLHVSAAYERAVPWAHHHPRL